MSTKEDISAIQPSNAISRCISASQLNTPTARAAALHAGSSTPTASTSSKRKLSSTSKKGVGCYGMRSIYVRISITVTSRYLYLTCTGLDEHTAYRTPSAPGVRRPARRMGGNGTDSCSSGRRIFSYEVLASSRQYLLVPGMMLQCRPRARYLVWYSI